MAIEVCRSVFPSDALIEADHYYLHGEPELAFEDLLIELMRADAVPDSYNHDEWCELARDLGIDVDSVFDSELYAKFLAWGSGKKSD